MVNLILDTNTWLYLANGFNQLTNSFDQTGYHIKLLADLQKLKAQNKIEIFVCETIVEEWKRNKSVTEVSVIKFQKSIAGTNDFIKGIKKVLSKEWRIKSEELFQEYQKIVEISITRHLHHISEVEKLIMSSPRIPITDEIRIEVTRLAERKQAPFHNKRNSVGDALILLSTTKYLEGKAHPMIENSIFISNNSYDYCDVGGGESIHPDLKQLFKKAQMKFETNLGRALNSSAEIIEEIDYYNEVITRDIGSCMDECKGADVEMDYVWYKNIIEFNIGENKSQYNPNQLRFDFGDKFVLTISEIEYLQKINTIIIKTGHCDFCNCFHLKCECSEILFTHNETNSVLNCKCGRKYLIKHGVVHLL